MRFIHKSLAACAVVLVAVPSAAYAQRDRSDEQPARSSETVRKIEQETGKPFIVVLPDSARPEDTGAVRIGEAPTNRPAPILENEIAMLKQRVSAAEARLAQQDQTIASLSSQLSDAISALSSVNGELAKTNAALADLSGKYSLHTHRYMAGVDYSNVSIHGHPAWDVPSKYVAQISRNMSFSKNWQTTRPDAPPQD